MLQQDRTVQATNPSLSNVLDNPPGRPGPLVSGCSANRSLWTIVYLSARDRLSLMLIDSALTFYDGCVFFPLLLCMEWDRHSFPLSKTSSVWGDLRERRLDGNPKGYGA